MEGRMTLYEREKKLMEDLKSYDEHGLSMGDWLVEELAKILERLDKLEKENTA